MVSADPQIKKAAILLMSLPQEEAGSIMGKLEPKQVEAVSIEIAKIGRISSEEQQDAIFDFADANPNNLGMDAGGLGALGGGLGGPGAGLGGGAGGGLPGGFPGRGGGRKGSPFKRKR